MKFSFGKIKSVLNKNTESQKVKDSDYIEKLKTIIKDKPFAESEQNIAFTGMKELAGYFYFRVVIVGKFKIKTFNGAKLTIGFKNSELKLNSDMNELESDFGPISNSYITPIDFEIEKKQIEQLNNSKIESIRVDAKKKNVTFTSNKA